MRLPWCCTAESRRWLVPAGVAEGPKDVAILCPSPTATKHMMYIECLEPSGEGAAACSHIFHPQAAARCHRPRRDGCKRGTQGTS